LGFSFINKGKYADAMQYFLKGQNISKTHLQEVTNSIHVIKAIVEKELEVVLKKATNL
jgi:hypothetical protein